MRWNGLDGTRIRTNVRTGGEEEFEGFGLIESFKLRRSEKTGRILEIARQALRLGFPLD